MSELTSEQIEMAFYIVARYVILLKDYFDLWKYLLKHNNLNRKRIIYVDIYFRNSTSIVMTVSSAYAGQTSAPGYVSLIV